MRVLSGVIFLLGTATLFFGLGLLFFPPGENWAMELLVKSGLAAIGVLLLGGSGAMWCRARWSDESLQYPDGAAAWSSRQTRRRLARCSLASLGIGVLVIVLFVFWMGNR
jgi:hypothetical protein